MEDAFSLIVVALLFGGLGWILGVAGYFRAGRALRELAALRAALGVPAPAVDAAEQPPSVPAVPQAGEVRVFGTPPEPAAPGPKRDWEQLLTARWGVWLGSAALLLAGVFLVRWAADGGLLGPGVRCAAALLLGAALIAGGEWLHRRPPASSPMVDYAPAALAAGGVGIVFGSAYMAAVVYGLVPPLAGFALMAAASLAGLLLSLRLGQLVAAVGIVGAMVDPLLVQTSDPSWPGLFAYLLFVSAAALAVVRLRAWVWLGWATTVAGAGWVLLGAASSSPAGIWAAGLFVPAAALLNLVLLPPEALDHPVGRRLAWVPVAAIGTAGLAVALAWPEASTRAGVLLLAPVTVGCAAREARLAWLPWLAALLFLLLILFWGLPPWHATGEVVMGGDRAIGIIPGAWAPAVLQPLLWTAAGMAAFFAAAGLWSEGRHTGTQRWSTLPAAVPVLALAILYVRVKNFQPDHLWAGAALLLAAFSTLAAAQARRMEERQRAGVHAAGATAALALGFATVTTGQSLTLALALLVPALAWIEGAAELPALRHVVLAAACVSILRLLFNPYVLDYATGERPFLNDLLPVYAVATVAFAAAARQLRRRADDLVVGVLELGSLAFGSAFVTLEIRHWATGGEPWAAQSSFREIALHVSALSILALVSRALQRRTGRAAFRWAFSVQGGLALAGAVGLILLNPAFVPAVTVGRLPIVNALLAAYAVPAAAAAYAACGLRVAARPLASYALAAIFAWITLEVRHDFHPDPGGMALNTAPVLDAELWAWSGAWLAYGLALMAAGIVLGRKALRFASLAVVALTAAKVFLLDLAGLVGLLRVLSLLGLGLTLIGLGTAYRR